MNNKLRLIPNRDSISNVDCDYYNKSVSDLDSKLDGVVNDGALVMVVDEVSLEEFLLQLENIRTVLGRYYLDMPTTLKYTCTDTMVNELNQQFPELFNALVTK